MLQLDLHLSVRWLFLSLDLGEPLLTDFTPPADARCTRSVSYATPAYYADRACTRAALLLEQDDNSDAATSHSGVSADQERSRMLRDYNNRLQAIHAKHKEALFSM